MVDVGHLRGDHLRFVRTGKEQKLVELVRADVAQDAAVALQLEEPGRAILGIHAVGPQSDRLDDLSDCPGLNQFPGLHGRAVLEALAIEDRVDAARLRLDAAHLGQLIERRNAGFVGHEILAVPHHLDAQRRPLVRDRSAEDQLDRVVLEDLLPAAREFYSGVTLDESRGQVGFRSVKGSQLAAASRHRVDLSIDVVVIHADNCKADSGGFGRHGRSLARGGGALLQDCRTQNQTRRAGNGGLEKIASINSILFHFRLSSQVWANHTFSKRIAGIANILSHRSFPRSIKRI